MEFQIAGGSVPGTDHTKPGKPGWSNTHDAFHWRQTDNCLVAVICDGCGNSGQATHSEVGAKLSARLLIEALAQAAEKYVDNVLRQPEAKTDIDWGRIKNFVLGHITVLASAMGESFSQTVNDYFLFTLVGAVVTPWNTFVFSVGDGVFVINGEATRLGPFPNNAPPYLAYNLTGSALTDTRPDLLEIRVHRIVPTNELHSLLLGSDGVLDLMVAADKRLPHRDDKVGDISQFWTDDRYFKNGDAVRRRLALINREGAEIVEGHIPRVTGGLLPDDTTVVVIRRNPTEKDEV